MDWILFDCMETLVDMEELPTVEDYASWAFHGSGVEDYWNEFTDFCSAFDKAGRFLTEALPEHKEWSTVDRLRLICTANHDIPLEKTDEIVWKLDHNFFRSYRDHCVVHKDVLEVIEDLAKQANLAVISNFKVKNGIETILEQFDLRRHFKFVITSIKNGWRKPHGSIYVQALAKTKSDAAQCLFVGDDLLNDVQIPATLGMKSVLLDRKITNHTPSNCVKNFYELKELVESNRTETL